MALLPHHEDALFDAGLPLDDESDEDTHDERGPVCGGCDALLPLGAVGCDECGWEPCEGDELREVF